MDFSTYKIPPKKQGTQPTYLHNIVKEVCQYLYGEDWKHRDYWSFWLGIGKRVSAGELKAKLEYAKQQSDPKYRNPAYFAACFRRPIS